MMTRAWAIALLALGVVASASPAAAHWEGAALGMSMAEARTVYPEGREQQDGRSIELPTLQAYGVTWDKAVLSFDARGRLQHVSLVVRGQDYDALKRRINDQFQAPRPGLVAITMPSGLENTLQFRICEMSDDSIQVTFERAWDHI